MREHILSEARAKHVPRLAVHQVIHGKKTAMEVGS